MKKPVLSFDDKNFLWLNDLKLPIKFFVNRMQFQFYDKNAVSAEKRGTPFVYIHIMALLNYIIGLRQHAECPICNQHVKVHSDIVKDGGEFILLSRCSICNFQWRHDEWT